MCVSPWRQQQQQQNLMNLTLLSLSGNALTRMPALMTCNSTPMLCILDLSHNLLETLPSFIGDLTSLSTLRLHHNRLRQLPPSLSRTLVMKTSDLTLAGNPLVHPLPLPLPPSHMSATCMQQRRAVGVANVRGMRGTGQGETGGINTGARGAKERGRGTKERGLRGGSAHDASEKYDASLTWHACKEYDASHEPPHTWVRQVMNELWELERAKSQRLSLSLVAFGPTSCALKLSVLDSLFGAKESLATAARGAVWVGERDTKGGRGWFGLRGTSGREGEGGGWVAGATAVSVARKAGMAMEDVLVEHSRLLVDARGQSLHLRLAALGGGGSGCSRWRQECLRGRSRTGVSGWDVEETAMRGVLEDELLPARMVPVFIWQSAAPTAQVGEV